MCVCVDFSSLYFNKSRLNNRNIFAYFSYESDSLLMPTVIHVYVFISGLLHYLNVCILQEETYNSICSLTYGIIQLDFQKMRERELTIKNNNKQYYYYIIENKLDHTSETTMTQFKTNCCVFISL